MVIPGRDAAANPRSYADIGADTGRRGGGSIDVGGGGGSGATRDEGGEGSRGEKPEESESSEGWLQGPAGSYVYQGCSHLGAPMGGFSGSGQCPPVTLNHPAVQSGPSLVRMRRQNAPLTSQRAPPSQLPTLRPSTPLHNSAHLESYPSLIVVRWSIAGPQELHQVCQDSVDNLLELQLMPTQ
ncbi:hypothetical protein WN48_04205 [Eufriesea mexicana]|uniref:Uncharacterized protein n=1 Tax=Eufriesea mexicana TaxID=516756 RepID=A0A310SDX8_9HYME|nr:hypothetical protein WN48_04205 [Eufriesea mexicana]